MALSKSTLGLYL